MYTHYIKKIELKQEYSKANIPTPLHLSLFVMVTNSKKNEKKQE